MTSAYSAQIHKSLVSYQLTSSSRSGVTPARIIGPQDIGNREPPPCIVVAQVRNGKWVRAHPTKVVTFDCSTKNITKIKVD